MVSKKQMNTFEKMAKAQRDLEAKALKEIQEEGEVTGKEADEADSYLSKVMEKQEEDLQDRTLRALRAIKLEEEAAKKQHKQ